MDKVEEKAMKYCCTKCTNNKLNCGMKLISHGRNCIACSNYIEGYHQAEKDNELTFDDIKMIIEIADKLVSDNIDELIDNGEEWYYKEVLKRFKEKK